MNIQMLVFDAIFIFFVQFKYKKIIFSHYFDVLWGEEKFYIKKKKALKLVIFVLVEPKWAISSICIKL